jgi:hypothetical protein
MDTVAPAPMAGWNTIPWKRVQRTVCKLQKRIYRASRRGEVRAVRKLQRLLMRSRSARRLAVRRVTQENHGKKTAGVEGVKSLTPPQQRPPVDTWRLGNKAKPVRRVWIPKPDTTEKAPRQPRDSRPCAPGLSKPRSNPNGKRVLNPTATAFDREGPTRMRAKPCSRPWAIKPTMP